MADQSKLEQMLEKLVNNDRAGADTLFHEFVIEKSRSIYEKMLEDEAKDLEVDEATDEEVDETTDEEVEECADEEVDESDEDLDEATDEEVEEASDEEVEEDFDEFAPEAEMDPTDDMMGDMEADDEADDEGDDDMEDRVVDLEDALDDLKAEFEKMMADDDGDDDSDDDAADMDMDDDEGDEDKEDESYDSELSVEDDMPAFEGKKTQAEQMREYVEKVAQPKGEDNKAKSPVAGKNDMGGTAGNIAAGGEGDTKGSAMSAKEDNAGNVNVPGGKASKSMSNAKAAEKSESGADTNSPIGS